MKDKDYFSWYLMNVQTLLILIPGKNSTILWFQKEILSKQLPNFVIQHLKNVTRLCVRHTHPKVLWHDSIPLGVHSNNHTLSFKIHPVIPVPYIAYLLLCCVLYGIVQGHVTRTLMTCYKDFETYMKWCIKSVNTYMVLCTRTLHILCS